jgi:hypothetical protein
MTKIPTSEELDELFRAGALERIGMGSRRACYRLPCGKLCVKCYRSDEEILEGKDPGMPNSRPLAPAAAKEIQRFRFHERKNTCCQEYRYWKNLPEGIRRYFPATIEMRNTASRGWSLIEELILNDDGSPIVKFLPAWMTSGSEERWRLASLLDEFEAALAHHSIRFFDPQTIMVQRTREGFRLRIPDFEPTTRTLIPVDALFPILARMKTRRRFARYRERLGISAK